MFRRKNRTSRRGSQVVRQRSAKPLFGGSIPPRASNNFPLFQTLNWWMKGAAKSRKGRRETEIRQKVGQKSDKKSDKRPTPWQIFRSSAFQDAATVPVGLRAVFCGVPTDLFEVHPPHLENSSHAVFPRGVREHCGEQFGFTEGGPQKVASDFSNLTLGARQLPIEVSIQLLQSTAAMHRVCDALGRPADPCTRSSSIVRDGPLAKRWRCYSRSG